MPEQKETPERETSAHSTNQYLPTGSRFQYIITETHLGAI